jgi:uncharacterized protein (TIGR00255 family)
MIAGMTGYGRAQGQADWGAWTWEARSVNGKNLDVRLNAPPGFEVIDVEARRRLKDRFQRGSFQVQLRIDAARGAGTVAIDNRELGRLARLARRWRGPGLTQTSFADLLATPGVVRAGKGGAEVDEAMAATLLASLDEALDQLEAARRQEGEMLARLFSQMLGEMSEAAATAAAEAVRQPATLREKFEARIAELTQSIQIEPERIAQEAALLAAKADVREELDRLQAHLGNARKMLAAGGAVGRKLDFLCQELNREANTLCSKSASLELTNAGLALKSLIDQFREQVQNVE